MNVLRNIPNYKLSYESANIDDFNTIDTLTENLTNLNLAITEQIEKMCFHFNMNYRDLYLMFIDGLLDEFKEKTDEKKII